MTHTEQYLETAQQYLDEQARLEYCDREEAKVLLGILRDLALVQLQADQLEQLELLVNKLHEEPKT